MEARRDLSGEPSRAEPSRAEPLFVVVVYYYHRARGTRAARTRTMTCADQSCPALVRPDCNLPVDFPTARSSSARPPDCPTARLLGGSAARRLNCLLSLSASFFCALAVRHPAVLILARASESALP